MWDLDTQHCCQTLGGHKAEVWALDVNPAGTRLATGATDNEIRVFAIRWVVDGRWWGGCSSAVSVRDLEPGCRVG